MEDKAAFSIYDEKRERVSKFNLTSDLFAGKVFENREACQELCRILMQDNTINIKDVKTQYTIRNLEKHSVELDILAEDVFGNLIDIEIQMYQEAEPFKRTRYYFSSIDMDTLEKGRAYHKLPAVTVITVTKSDFIGGGKGYYEIVRKWNCHTAAKNVDNGQYEKYFNLEHPTNNAVIDELLSYFQNADPFYKTESFPYIVKRVNYLKIKKEGIDTMCEIADSIRKEGEEFGIAKGRIEGKVEDILELLADVGKIPQQIVQHIKKETNPDILRKWLKCAARAASIAEFESNMNQ